MLSPPTSSLRRRILSLDGGGIRGVLTLKILESIEAEFRRARGRPNLVLRDEFEFLAGTSTGGIIATCLAWGMAVDEILKIYQDLGDKMFKKTALWKRYWKHKYDPVPIANFFKSRFAEDDGSPALFGTDKFSVNGRPTTVLVTMRNVRTGSAWPVSNNPEAVYNSRANPECNLQIPIWKLLRASSAAPTFFPPEEIKLGGVSSLFVDGGLTPYNNPALIALLTATLPCYRMQWPTGADCLQVVSVGSGRIPACLTKTQANQLHTLDFVRYIAPAMISNVGLEQDLICRLLGDCRYVPFEIDSEVGKLDGEGLLKTTEKKFSYVRYDRVFSSEEISDFERATRKQFRFDNPALIPELIRLGDEYAKAHVRSEHLDI
jgi:hypothetical protein